MLLLFVVGDIIGAGIYARVGEVAGAVGGAIWVSFLVAIVIAALTGLSYAELVTKYPGAAGAALYVDRAFKTPFFTFVIAFAVVASGLASVSAIALAFGGDYLSVFLDAPTVAVAALFVLALGLVNFWGISEAVWLNVVLCTVVSIVGLLLVTVVGIAAYASGIGDLGRPFTFSAETAAPLAVVAGASIAFYAMLGFEDSVNVAEEAHDPVRNYPRALLGGLAVAGVVYVVVAFVAALVVNPGTLAGSTGPLLEVVALGPLSFLAPPQLFSFIALLAITNTALINLIMASRVVYGMARQGVVPGALGKIHRARRTPWVAIAFTTLIPLVLVTTGDTSDLAQTTVALLLAVFTIVNVSVLVLRRDRVEHRHFKAPVVIPLLGAASCLALLTQQDTSIFARAGVLLLLGLVLWLVNVLVLHFGEGAAGSRADGEKE